MRRLLTIKICFLILSFLILASSASAQKLRFIETPIHFPSGGSPMTLTGTVTDRIRPLYIFRARKGQTIRVRITSKDDQAFFNVFDYAQKQYNGVDGLDIPNDWAFTFEGTDKYEIVVMINKGSAKYTLEVSLK